MINDLLKGRAVILGSLSPRRRELLGKLDIDFDVAEPSSSEIPPPYTALNKVAETIALEKARSIASKLNDGDILITADTVVISGNTLMPKPSRRSEAVGCLRRLSGGDHRVITGVALVDTNKERLFSEETMVFFDHIDSTAIDYYIDRYKPYDKAGGYGIQEWIGYLAVRRIEGCFYNVMGLPVNRLFKEMNLFITS